MYLGDRTRGSCKIVLSLNGSRLVNWENTAAHPTWPKMQSRQELARALSRSFQPDPLQITNFFKK